MPHSQIGGKLLKSRTFQAVFPGEMRFWDFPRELAGMEGGEIR
jgi:hypothetical protein